jgi:hypothetical protein
MTSEELIAAGFKPFPPNPQMGDSWGVGYQKRIVDNLGTRYFIDVHKWNRRRVAIDLPDGFEVTVSFGDGCNFHPRAAVRIHAFAGTSNWSVPDVLSFASELWIRLGPHYYEQNV